MPLHTVVQQYCYTITRIYHYIHSTSVLLHHYTYTITPKFYSHPIFEDERFEILEISFLLFSYQPRNFILIFNFPEKILGFFPPTQQILLFSLLKTSNKPPSKTQNLNQSTPRKLKTSKTQNFKTPQKLKTSKTQPTPSYQSNKQWRMLL